MKDIVYITPLKLQSLANAIRSRKMVPSSKMISVKEMGEIFSEGAGAYDDKGVLKKSWQKLIEDGNIYFNENQELCSSDAGYVYYEEEESEYFEAIEIRFNNLSKLVISKEIEVIGNYAFFECADLKELILPNTISTIKEGAFARTGVSQVILPNNAEIEGAVFAQCNALESITIPAGCKFKYTNGDLSFGAFEYCENLKKVILEEGALSVGKSAFAFCSSLADVEIPNSVKTIESDAFFGCTSLADITLPDGLVKIKWGAFSGCKITTIEIPETVSELGDSVFLGCKSLSYVKVPSTFTVVPSYFLGGTKINDQCFHEVVANVTKLNMFAFYECDNLVNIVIPDSVTYLGDFVFSSCKNLESVVCSKNLSSIETGAFQNCSKLEQIIIPDSVTTIGNSVFFGCPSLTTIYYNGPLTDAKVRSDSNATVVRS